MRGQRTEDRNGLSVKFQQRSKCPFRQAPGEASSRKRDLPEDQCGFSLARRKKRGRERGQRGCWVRWYRAAGQGKGLIAVLKKERLLLGTALDISFIILLGNCEFFDKFLPLFYKARGNIAHFCFDTAYSVKVIYEKSDFFFHC